MTAKEYLDQLRMLELKAKHETDFVDELREKAYGLKAVNYSKDNVQSGRSGAKEDLIIKIVDMEREGNLHLERYLNYKRQIVDRIHMLNNQQYADILYKRHVEYKSFGEIAEEMNFCDVWVQKLYKRALISFGQLLNRL